MKNLILLVFTALYSFSAFAIDQITLKSGEIVQGKVLNEVPNLHVDIEMTNGTKKRFSANDVANVERDVPSNKDTQMLGNDSRIYLGVLAGAAFWSANGSSTKTQFAYGARFGVNATPLGDFATLAVGLDFDRYSVTSDPVFGTASTYTYAYNNLMAEILFRRIAGGGFYIGPELGITIQNRTIGNLSLSGTSIAVGGVAGYDYYSSSSFSFGPEAQFVSHAAVNGTTTTASTTTLTAPSTTDFKVLATMTFHFE